MMYKRFLRHFLVFKWSFLIGIIFVIFSAASSRYAPMLVRNLIDDIILSLHSENNTGSINSKVITFLFYYLGLTLIGAIFTFLMRQTIVVASRNIEYNLKNDFYNHIQRMEITSFKQYAVGDYMSRLSEDIGKIRELFGPAIMYLVNLITTLIISLILMCQIDPWLTFWSLLPLPFLSIFIFVFNQYSYRYNTKLQEHQSLMTSLAQESYNGIRIIKSFTLEDKILSQFGSLSELYKKLNLKLVFIESFFMPITSFLMSLSLLVVIFLGGKLLLTDPSRLTLGGLTFMIMTLTNLTWPIMAVGWVATLVQRGSAAMTRYDEILKLPIEQPSKTSADIDFRMGSIRFDNVSYTYPDTKIEALKNLNFEIPLGERWLIIGKTGSGKSTLAELLLKFYLDYGGTITINDHELREIPTDQLRVAISYIPQDVFLFSDTVANNIAFSDSNLDPSSITAAAKNAQIASEIDRFQHGYETVVGERGITLSGGQKQRISIARALIKPAPIYVFDDCLSAVDVETEKNLIAAIDAQAGKHTMVMITHRIFNQLRFDNILVLSNGSILELGNHEDLIKANGYYAQLYRRQELMKQRKASSS